jgi:integrase/recombinase XerC
MKLKDAVTLFLGEYQKPSTRRTYHDVLIPMCENIGAGRPVENIQTVDLIAYSQDIRERGYREATVQKHFRTIKIFFNWLVRLGEIPASPARAIRQKRLSGRVTREKAMTDTELSRILDFAKWHPRNYALILFLADTGCRAGGASSLMLKNLDLEKMTAVVTEKGDKTRNVAFGQQCAQAIRAWLLKRPKSAGEYVFSPRKEPLSPDSISQVVRRACLKTGVRSLGSHSLRHRKGHQFADAKVAPSIAATALGHSDVVITLTHYYPADWESAEKELRKLSTNTEDKPAKILQLKGS